MMGWDLDGACDISRFLRRGILGFLSGCRFRMLASRLPGIESSVYTNERSVPFLGSGWSI